MFSPRSRALQPDHVSVATGRSDDLLGRSGRDSPRSPEVPSQAACHVRHDRLTSPFHARRHPRALATVPHLRDRRRKRFVVRGAFHDRPRRSLFGEPSDPRGKQPIRICIADSRTLGTKIGQGSGEGQGWLPRALALDLAAAQNRWGVRAGRQRAAVSTRRGRTREPYELVKAATRRALSPPTVMRD